MKLIDLMNICYVDEFVIKNNKGRIGQFHDEDIAVQQYEDCEVEKIEILTNDTIEITISES